MDRFIRCQNVKRYRRLLERVTEELDRQTIRNLLAEELQKQRDAGDPILIRRVGNQFAPRSLYRRSRDEFLSRRSKAPAPRAPQPPAGAFLTSGRDLAEQFCTDGYCQGVQASGGEAREGVVSAAAAISARRGRTP